MSKPWVPVRMRVLIVCSLVSLILSGCKSWSERGAKGVGTLPPASANETNFSPYKPTNPYQQLTKGLLGRKLHAATPAEAGVAVEVHDFLIGPNQKTDPYSLPGNAIFEVKSGSGVLKLGDKGQPIGPGTAVDVPASGPFTIENQTDIPIAIRVVILGSK